MNALVTLTDLDKLATIGWPPALPIELALGVMEPIELKDHYSIPDAEWDALPKNPAFVQAVQSAMDALRQQGMGFKMRAQLLAEGNLQSAQQMIGDKSLPASVRKDLVIAMARWAGYDSKAGEGGNVNALGAAFQINISLGDA